jgi:hemoglobin-like flavoprotein
MQGYRGYCGQSCSIVYKSFPIYISLCILLSQDSKYNNNNNNNNKIRPMSLTRNQVGLIKATIPILKDHGTAITCHFYYLLLSQNPTLNNIFNLTNQKTGHQSLALASSLHAYASNIDDLGVLSPALQRICHKHASMSVKAEHYSVVGEYLLRAMGHVLGEALTTDTMEAWEQAYWQLADMVSVWYARQYKTGVKC